MDRSRGKAASSRRNFMKSAGTVTASVVASSLFRDTAQALPALPFNPATADAMPTRNLGRTGHRVAIFSLGGQAAIEQPDNQAVAVPIVERAIDHEVNYIDTAALYGGKQRWSQRHIGEVMKHRRGQVYLASQTDDRPPDRSLRLLEESLRLLALWPKPGLGMGLTRSPARHPEHEGGALFHALAACEHGDHRLRLCGPARGEHPAGARLRPFDRAADGCLDDAHQTSRAAIAVFAELGVNVFLAGPDIAD